MKVYLSNSKYPKINLDGFGGFLIFGLLMDVSFEETHLECFKYIIVTVVVNLNNHILNLLLTILTKFFGWREKWWDFLHTVVGPYIIKTDKMQLPTERKGMEIKNATFFDEWQMLGNHVAFKTFLKFTWRHNNIFVSFILMFNTVLDDKLCARLLIQTLFIWEENFNVYSPKMSFVKPNNIKLKKKLSRVDIKTKIKWKLGLW